MIWAFLDSLVRVMMLGLFAWITWSIWAGDR
jgi:hypothetical protein